MRAEFQGRVAIVTGGASGIGWATATLLGRGGARVCVWDRKIDSVGGKVQAAQAEGTAMDLTALDVGSWPEVQAAMGKAVAAFGRVDILVNCAGVFSSTAIDAISFEEWQRVFSVNVGGTFVCCQSAIPHMRKQGYGRIINVGSIGGKQGGPVSSADYAASKAAVMCLTKSFARFVAKENITVNCVSPGVIKTEMTSGWPSSAIDQTVRAIPIGRLGEASEVASAIAFLASEKASYITGEILDVNGGQLMD